MKNAHPLCHKGCPEDNFMKCFAYDENGRLCNQPATKLDPVRGCYVCQKHANESVNRLLREGAGCLDFVVLPVQLTMQF